jgi:hypothetical protein
MIEMAAVLSMQRPASSNQSVAANTGCPLLVAGCFG